VVLFFFALLQQKKMRSTFASIELFQRLSPWTSSFKQKIKFALLLIALGFIVIGFANPQIGSRFEEVKAEAIDIFIALDVSKSMKAEDVQPNRLEAAKYAIGQLLGMIKGDRVGLSVFAGDAYVQFPLTLDYSAAKIFLDAIDVETAPVPGSALGTAIQMADKSFNDIEDETEKKNATNKVLILITDGENTEGDAFAAATDAAKNGVLIYTIGVGSVNGSPIPEYRNGQQDFKRDREGNVVVTKLDEESLVKLASIGNGKYYRATTGGDELVKIFESINKLQKREIGVKQFTEYESRYQYFLFAALLLLIAEVFISEKKSNTWKKIKSLAYRNSVDTIFLEKEKAV
jgi:Ca-activated chloride channel family protein